jgi:hypothetical protein
LSASLSSSSSNSPRIYTHMHSLHIHVKREIYWQITSILFSQASSCFGAQLSQTKINSGKL